MQYLNAKLVAKAGREANKCSKPHGYWLKGKVERKRPIPMNSVKPLTGIYYQLKSGHKQVGTHLE
jgi:hypothetical protein